MISPIGAILKRYVTLRCSVCARTKDELIDQTHYTPDRCTITLNCEGRLSPTGFTSAGSAVLSVPPDGLTNWYPRGSTITTTTTTPQADALYDTSTGIKQQIVLALFDPSHTISSNATIQLNLLAEQQTPKDYRQYTYRKSGSVTIVNGVEDGAAKKVLRYNITGINPDMVEVYVNGVKRTQGTGSDQYQLYDGTVGSPAPLNSVLFNTPVTGVVSQIDVTVSKAATLTTAQLTFQRVIDDESRVGTGAWEGVEYVTNVVEGPHTLFYCDFSTVSNTFSTDVKLRLNPNAPSILIDGVNLPITPSNAALLLSRAKLYTPLDRQRSMWIPLSALSTDANYMIVKLDAAVKTMFITEASAANLFPTLDVQRYGTRTLQSTNLTGNTDSAQLDNTIIIGPDV